MVRGLGTGGHRDARDLRGGFLLAGSRGSARFQTVRNPGRFRLDDIWDFDWESCRQRACGPASATFPQEPIAPPSLFYRMAGKGIDVLRVTGRLVCFSGLKSRLSRLNGIPRAGWKRQAFELCTWACGLAAPRVAEPPGEPRSIFVLRNNDIGDLLAVTPLFEALKRRYPRAKIIAGVGSWNLDVLKSNPFVDEVLPVNAPWHNQRTRPQGVRAALNYIMFSGEVKNIASHRCDIGIDVLGSAFGSLLLMRAGIPFRLGVRGYAGGHSAAQRCLAYDELGHVGRGALRFAELLGATALPENRPQLYLDTPLSPSDSVVIAPGGGFVGKMLAGGILCGIGATASKRGYHRHRRRK